MDDMSIYFKQVQLLLEAIPFINKEVCFALKGGIYMRETWLSAASSTRQCVSVRKPK